MKNLSAEQAVRDLLELAIKEGLVAPTTEYRDPDPQCRSSGELVALANYLHQWVRATEPRKRAAQ